MSDISLSLSEEMLVDFALLRNNNNSKKYTGSQTRSYVISSSMEVMDLFGYPLKKKTEKKQSVFVFSFGFQLYS